MGSNPARSTLAVLLAVLLVGRPALAGPPASAGTASTGTAVVDPLAAWAAAARLQRNRVAQQLIDLGRPAPQAHAMADRLTAEDLAVLTANPGMLRAAGGDTARQLTILWGVLIVAGLIALAAATDGTVSFG
jgi:hypothetical protein